jgi:hypothetical protein
LRIVLLLRLAAMDRASDGVRPPLLLRRLARR